VWNRCYNRYFGSTETFTTQRHAAYFAYCHFRCFANGLIVNICWKKFVLLCKEPLFFARKREFEDLALSGRIPRKHARRAQRFTFINNFERLYKNPGEIC